MASRGSSGLIVLTSVLGILAAGGLGVGLWGYTQSQSLQKQLDDQRKEVGDYVRDGEKNNDAVRELVNEAKRGTPPQSLVGYLSGNFQNLAEKVSGQRNETPASLVKKIDAVLTPLGKSNLVAGVSELGAELIKARAEIKAAEASRQESIDTLRSSQERIKALEEAHQAAIASLSSGVDTYKGQIDTYREDLNKRVSEMQASVDKIKRDAADEATRLNDRIAKLNEELLIAQGKVRSLQGARNGAVLKPGDEAALVDGEVVALVDADNTVFINRGRNQRVVLGMSFEVYSDATQIKSDAGRGKGAVEVISVDDNSSVARVVRATRGNPISRGDVIVNPVYDPSKKYKFVVAGLFDTTGDGRATPGEAEDIRALIAGWGALTVDALAGDVDFVVLGSRPIVPPTPPSDAPAALVDQFVRAKRAAAEYDALFAAATAAGIPVLNQNRLLTLMGK